MDSETIILIVFSSIGTFICIHSAICAYIRHTDKDLDKDLIEKV